MAKIITIARQYGSGGREIGHLLAEKLGWDYYDNNLISLAAKDIGVDPEKLHSVDEKVPNSILYTLAVGSSVYGSSFNPDFQPINDRLFNAQSKIIEDIGEKGNAIIVGRCADFVLEDRDDIVTVFVYSDFDKRVKTVAERHNLSISDAKSLVVKTDRRRANYYNYYTGKKWGKTENYDLMISTSNLSVEKAADIIKALVD